MVNNVSIGIAVATKWNRNNIVWKLVPSVASGTAFYLIKNKTRLLWKLTVKFENVERNKPKKEGIHIECTRTGDHHT